MNPTPALTRCSSRTVDLPVHETCAALDWLCARAPGAADRPGWWRHPAPTLRQLQFDRHTRHGPPDGTRYAPYRQLDGHLRRRTRWPLPVQLEVFPWDRRHSELTLRPLFNREFVLPHFADYGFAAVRDLAIRLCDIAAATEEADLDDAALTVLLDTV